MTQFYKWLVVVSLVFALMLSISLCISGTRDSDPISVITQSSDLPRTIKRVISSVVYVKSDRWSGSGVIVGPNVILTAAHIVRDANNLEVHTVYGSVYKIVSPKWDSDNGCGLMFIEGTFRDVAELGDSDLVEVGDEIFTIGTPYNKQLFNSVAYGRIARTDCRIPYFNIGHTIIGDMVNHPGRSGGPVFNTDGKVIGIVVGYVSGISGGLTAITPVNTCKELFNEVNICR